jgi:hypothetical protein
MITKIQTSEDVNVFAKQLIAEGVSFHPDNDFNDIINLETNESTYSPEEAQKRNELMSQCFAICEKEGLDIYDISMEITLVETGLDKLVPLPSQPY